MQHVHSEAKMSGLRTILFALIASQLTGVVEGILGESCLTSVECRTDVANAVCSNSRCVCPPTHYARSGSNCALKVAQNGPCTMSAACADSNTSCYKQRCVCKRNWFWHQTACHNVSALTPIRRTNSARETNFYINWYVDITYFSVISDYVITWSREGSSQTQNVTVAKIMSGTTTSQGYTISGLTGRTDYHVQVVSRIKNDPRGQRSPPLSMEFKTRAGYQQECLTSADCYGTVCRDDTCLCSPGNFRYSTVCRTVKVLRPYRIIGSDPTTSSVKAVWYLSSSYTRYVTMYSVTGRSHGNGVNVTVNATSTTADLPGLEPGTNYSLSVRSLISEDGMEQWSPTSPVVNVTTRPDVPGSLDRKATLVGDDMMLLVFRPVARGAADSYQVTLLLGNEVVARVDRNGNTTAAVFMGLRPGELYTVNVTAGLYGLHGDSHSFSVETLQAGVSAQPLEAPTAEVTDDDPSPAMVPAHAVAIAVIVPTVIFAVIIGVIVARQRGNGLAGKIQNLASLQGSQNKGAIPSKRESAKNEFVKRDGLQKQKSSENVYEMAEGAEYERYYEELRHK